MPTLDAADDLRQENPSYKPPDADCHAGRFFIKEGKALIDAIVAIKETVKTAAEALARIEEFNRKHSIRLVGQKHFIQNVVLVVSHLLMMT